MPKKKDNKIKAVIFDLWGTILENGVYPSPTKQSKKILGQFSMLYPEFVIRFERAFMTKKCKDIKEGLKNVFTEFDANPDDYNRTERLIGLWNKAKIMSELYPNTVSTLKDLKKEGYKLILLSNLPSPIGDIIERFGFAEYFDEIFVSYEIGCIKSEGGFEKVLKKTGFSTDEVIMVGDSMESDMQGAEKAGIKGVLIDRRNVREYKNKITTLKDLSKKIKEVSEDG